MLNEEEFIAEIELKSILSIRIVLGYELFLGVYFQFLALMVCQEEKGTWHVFESG